MAALRCAPTLVTSCVVVPPLYSAETAVTTASTTAITDSSRVKMKTGHDRIKMRRAS